MLMAAIRLIVERGPDKTTLKAVGERLADANTTVTVDEIAGFETLSVMLQRHRGGLLVLGHDCVLVAGRDDELYAIGCPVLLTRAPEAAQGSGGA